MTPELREALDAFTPPPDDARLDWDEALRRAGLLEATAANGNGHLAPTAGPIRRRRLLPALAVTALVACGLALLTPVGPAIGRSLGDFTDWLTGEPGQPAPRAQQEAFARSTRSWAGFPPGTELRRLVEAKAGGATLTLYGFRGAGSLCVRLDATNEQRSELSCPPLSELKARAEPALVVAADRGIGDGKAPASGPIRFPEPAARVTYGIVADGVDRVEVRRSDGTMTDALVSGDAFLDVDTAPAETRRVTQIWAVSGGRRAAVPFVPEATFFGLLAGGAPAREPRGPATVERKQHGGAIRWLARRELRGTAVPKNVHHIVGVAPGIEFARQIAPDPSAPERMVVSVGDQVCAELVGGRYQGGSCTPRRRMFSTAPFEFGVRRGGGDQYVTVAGLASDDVARLVLFLATGKRLPVPLHDNGYFVEAPRAGYPLRLVAYDAAGRVIGVATLKGEDGPPAWRRLPAPGATWRTVLRNAAGEAFVVRATPDGGCYAIRLARSGGGRIGCQPPPRPRELQVGFSRSGNSSWVLSGRVGRSVVRVVVTFAGGHAQTVTPVGGFVLAPLDSDAKIDSLAGVDAAGRRVVLHSFARSPAVGGGATIHGITARSISFGVSPATEAKLQAQGKAPRLTTCRRTKTSPPLAGYRPGVHVRYICRGGALSLIGRAPKSTRWQDRTTWGRGRITALTSSSLTIRDTGEKLTCTFTPSSPPVTAYRRGEQVEVFCVHGALTGLNRARKN